MLSENEGQILVRLARQTIMKHLGLDCPDQISPQELLAPVYQQSSGVFVTLNKRGALRGCIGSLVGAEKLADGICHHALNAAFHDSRFPPLSSDELEHLKINISILTPPQTLEYRDAEDLLVQLRPGIDGVILSGPGGRGATFLLQVWKQLPIKEIFLGHLCLKAGLSEGCWRAGDVAIQTYQAQYFEEN